MAVILGEPGSDELAVHLENALTRLMPAAIRVEFGIVIEARLWPAGQDIVDRFLRDARIDIVPVDADLAARAMSGWRRYGKGAIRRGSISATASPTRSPSGPGIPYCALATTSPRRTSP